MNFHNLSMWVYSIKEYKIFYIPKRDKIICFEKIGNICVLIKAIGFGVKR